MNLNPEEIITLSAQLTEEYSSILENFKLNNEAWGRIQNGALHDLDWAALGYTLHTIYTAMEKYFIRISKAFENSLPPEGWHKELILRMQLDLPGIRPRLLEKDLARGIDELRGFRHIFRSLYDDRLDPDRIRFIQEKIPAISGSFAEAHQLFLEKLQQLALEKN
jgi:hypothetical protein